VISALKGEFGILFPLMYNLCFF